MKDVQSRREFFKSAAKAALPILGAVVLSNLPQEIQASVSGCNGCTGSCSSSCTSCTGSCTSSCTGCAHSCESQSAMSY